MAPSSLETLLKQMNSPEQFSCPRCERTYTKKTGLITHCIRVHGEPLSSLLAADGGIELLECKICGLRSNSLNRHVIAQHGMSPRDYVEKFPGAETMRLTPEQNERSIATKRAKDTHHKHHVIEFERRRQESLLIGMQPLRCQLCDHESMFSLVAHIRGHHGLSGKDYKEKFPGCCIQQSSPAQVQKQCSTVNEKLKDPLIRQRYRERRSTLPSEVKHWTDKGLSQSDALLRVSEFQRQQSVKGNNPITRLKRSARSTGDNNPMSLRSIARRQNVTLAVAHSLTPGFGRAGAAHPMFGKNHSPEALEKIASAEHLKHGKGRSTAERELEVACSTIDHVNHNVRVGRWNVDVKFTSRNLIVELFGDFWHMNPNKYAPDCTHVITKMLAKEVWNRDERKLRGLREQGHCVEVVWESEWRHDRESCMQRIKDAYDRALSH